MNVRRLARPLALVLFAAGCNAAPARLGADKPAATVNGVPLTHDDLVAAMGRKGHGAADEASMAERAKLALEGLVRQEILAQKAVEKRLDHDSDVAERLAAAEAQYLAARRAILADVYMAREIMAPAVIADAEVDAFVSAHADALKNEYVFWQIAVNGDEARAREFKQALDAGEPFEKVAARRFDKLPEGQRPWELPPLRYLQLPEDWRDTAVKLQPGQVSDVLKAGDRYWIVKLVSVRPLTNAGEGEREAIRAMLQNQKGMSERQAKFEALVKSAKITYGE